MQCLKVVVVGNTKVGKSCILSKYIKDSVDLHTPPTIGAAYSTKVVSLPSGQVRLQLWDTAGQEQFRSLAPMYYRGANVVILVFDVTSKESLEDLDNWSAEIADQAPQGVKTVLVGNKIDLISERCVSIETAKSVANSIGASFYAETSAITGIGINEVFNKIAEFDNTIDTIIETPSKIKPNLNQNNSCCILI